MAFDNIAQVLEPACALEPDRPALVVGDKVTTYAELADLVARAGGALRERGVQPGDRVVLADGAGPLAMATVLGAARAGAVAAPMNPRLTANEMRDLVGVLGGCAVGVAGPESVDALKQVTEILGRDELAAGTPVAMHDGGDADGLILFTSGTTGLPKAVVSSHRAVIERIMTFAQPATGAGQVRLLCVPIFHVGGLLGQCVSFYAGHTTVVQRRFDAGEWLRLVARHRIQVTFLVPTMVARILDHPDFTRTDLSALESITYGAAPMPESVLVRAVETLPHVAFTNTFGQTETLGGIMFLTADDHRHPVHRTSVGKLLPSATVRIVDANGTNVSPGQPGELWVARPDGSWLHTGDIVTRDADDYFYVAGRLSETINRGGEKFGPTEVEAAIRTHPLVTDVVVATIPHRDLGEVAGAVVAGHDGLSATDVIAWCRDRLVGYKVPDRVLLVAEVPYTDLGKADRRAAAALLAQEV